MSPVRTAWRRQNRTEPGMVSVEWALTIPLFITLVMFCVALVIYTNNMALTTDAAREAARAYSIGQGAHKAEEAALTVAGDNAHVHIHLDGEFVEVTVEKPAIDQLAFLGVTVQSTHVALLEPGVTP